ncbi:hypothetical protein RchiOBHm_Chr7g0186281 [Rosa chinensis]|uniref:Uncharacterized protein n=1 Tax=Rosa chinensis TaxID=74649 RepID=A0A2P6P3W6_ROSCH|nr:hypothetical protein RchiOBHm_Chr7g0186281 [Rosa chinensis]
MYWHNIRLDLPYGHSFTVRLSSPHIGPRGISGDLGTYAAVNWFFLAGAIAPVLVWLAATAFPQKKWIRLINMPVLIIGTGHWLLRLTTLSFLDHFGFSLWFCSVQVILGIDQIGGGDTTMFFLWHLMLVLPFWGYCCILPLDWKTLVPAGGELTLMGVPWLNVLQPQGWWLKAFFFF